MNSSQEAKATMTHWWNKETTGTECGEMNAPNITSKLEAITCPECLAAAPKLPDAGKQSSTDGEREMFSHVFCDNCKTIQPVKFEGYWNTDISESFLGGDLICQSCAFIVATLYRPESVEQSLQVGGKELAWDDPETYTEFVASQLPADKKDESAQESRERGFHADCTLGNCPCKCHKDISKPAGVASILGTLPGDETDAELLSKLAAIDGKPAGDELPPLDVLRKEFEGCITEIGANKTLTAKDDYNKGWNAASDNAIKFIRRYIKGEGLFQL